jgi:hypothetical protein
MNGTSRYGDQQGRRGSFPPRHDLGKSMSGTIGFFIAVAIVSGISLLLMARTERARDRRRAYADSSQVTPAASRPVTVASACSTGSTAAPRRPHPTTPAVRPPPPFSAVATAAAAMGEAVATAAAGVAATNPTPGSSRYLDPFQVRICASLELLKTPCFPFASCGRLQISIGSVSITQRARPLHDRLLLQRPQRP